jgi:hypothetical protein
MGKRKMDDENGKIVITRKLWIGTSRTTGVEMRVES